MTRPITAALVAVAWLLWAALPLHAQMPHRAGLIVMNGDGVVQTRCVEFETESISGAELLTRSGLDVRLEATGMGATVCSIEGEGCGPGRSCFCQCQSSPCFYWSYWQWDDGEWRYSNLGAGLNEVADGGLEAWVWGEGNMSDAAESKPPALSLAEICAAPPAGDDTTAEDAAAPSAPDGPPADLPWSTVLVVGAPLLGVLGWWVAQQRRRA